MPVAPQDRPDMQVFSTITAIDHLMRVSISRRLPPGMPYAQFELLRLFARDGDGQTPAELARAMMMTKGAITNILQRMEAEGLIEVLADASDGRKKRVRVSRKGRELYGQISKALRSNTQQLRGAFTEAEFREAAPFLNALRVFLEDITGPDAPADEPR